MDRLRESVGEKTDNETDPLRRIKLGIQTYFHTLTSTAILSSCLFKSEPNLKTE
jgi:hypothetical protein